MSIIKRRWEDIRKKLVEPEVRHLHDVIKTQQEQLSKSEAPAFFQRGVIGEMDKGKPYREGVDFKTLRQFSQVYDVARMCINRRKRQIEKLEWYVAPTNETEDKDKYKSEIKETEDFLSQPMGKYSRFRDFINKIIEDALVIDAPVVWKDKEGGVLKKLVPVDGSTIKLRVLADGTTPEPPEIAYEQWIQGKLVGQFTTDEMIYMTLNPRTTSPYGFAPLESLVLGVDAALKSQLYNLSMLTEGNVPEGFWMLPESYTPEDVKEFQQWFDALITGKRQHKLKFMPGGKGTGYQAGNKPQDMRYVEYEKWLLHKTCAILDIMPSDIGFTEDVNRATAQTQAVMGERVGQRPLMQLIKTMLDIVIQEDMGYDFLEFNWKLEEEEDELKNAQADEILVKNGIKSIDQAREERGWEAIGVDNFVILQGQPVFIRDIAQGIIPQPAVSNNIPQSDEEGFGEEITDMEIVKKDKVVEDLEKWKRKAENDIKKGQSFREFESDDISDDLQKLIKSRLMFAKNRNDIKSIFNEQIQSTRQNSILREAMNLKKEISKTLEDYEEIEGDK